MRQSTWRELSSVHSNVTGVGSGSPDWFLLVGCVAMALCGVFTMVADAASKEPVSVTVMLKDLSEKPLELTAKVLSKEVLEVRLEQKAVGYVWKLDEFDPKHFEMLSSERDLGDDPKPGGSEFLVYKFRVLEPGKLAFEWKRPFGKSNAKLVKISVGE